MKKLLGKILQWTLLGILCLSIPSALADPIQQQVGIAALDQSSPRVWRHGTASPTSTGTVVASASQYAPVVKSVTYGCDGTCTNLEPILKQDPTSDGELASNNTLAVSSYNYGFNGTTFDRLRTGNTGDSDTGIGKLHVLPMLFNATDAEFERMRVAGGDALTNQGMAAAGNMVFNGTTWDRVRSATDTAAGTGLLGSVPMALNSSNNPGAAAAWNQLAAAGATTFAGTANGGRFLLTAAASTWSVTNTPATATQATASRAAGAAGVRHVATTVTVCLATGATAQTPILAHLRDGATGAGTILRSWAHSAPANSTFCNNISDLAMLGTAATAMTIEFTGAGVTASQQTVTLTGFSTQ